MRHVRRTEYLFVYLHSGRRLDMEQLLRGVTRLAPSSFVYAISILRGTEYLLTTQELQLLLEVPSGDWIAVSDLDIDSDEVADALQTLVHHGLLLSDDPAFADLLKRDEQLSAGQWNIYAALYHFMKQWQDTYPMPSGGDDPPLNDRTGSDQIENSDADLDVFEEPSHHFHAIDDPVSIHQLPLGHRDGAFYETLLRRRTKRTFDAAKPLNIEALATILYYVFGCQGHFLGFKGIHALMKTSASGGGLHPIEAYVLTANVSGLPVGLYHYNVEYHTLEMHSRFDRQEAAALADVFTAGQRFARDAHVLLVLTARFHRNFWKYRKHPKAYGVVLMDAGHLGQTFALLCADLGLASFFTAAINDVNIEQRLGLDGTQEGAIAILGCGIAGVGEQGMDPVFEPYVPGQMLD